MHSVLSLSPSLPPAMAMAAPVTGTEVDPSGGFSLALSGGEATGDDEETVADPAGVEGQTAAGPVLLWAGAVVKAGGADGAAVSEAAARIVTAGRSGIGAAVPVSARMAAAALAWEMAPPAPSVPGAQGTSGEGGGDWVVRLGEAGQPSAGTGPVAPADSGAGQAVEAREAYPGAPETGRGGGLAEPVPQVAAAAGTAHSPQPRSGQGQVAEPGQRDVGSTGVGAVAPWLGDADRIGEGPISGLIGGDEGGLDLAPTGPNAPASLPAQADTKRVPAPVSAPQAEGATTGDGMPARAERLAGDDVADEPIFIPEGAAKWPGRVVADGRPQAGFWERHLSAMADARAFATAEDGLAGPGSSARPEDRGLAPLVATMGAPSAVMPEGADLAKPGAVGPGAQGLPAGATAERFAPAEPTAPEAAPPTPDVAPKAATPETGPRSTASGSGGLSAHPLAEAAPEPDPNRKASGDPALFAPGAAPLSLLGPQASPASAASPVPIPQLAAQLTAALTRQTGGETELALSPGELGHVRLKLKPDAAHPDRLVVMITFERPETLDLFRRHAGELTDALRSAGYSGADIGFGQQGRGEPDPDPPAGTARQSFDGSPRPDPAGAAHPSPRHASAASLDLRL